VALEINLDALSPPSPPVHKPSVGLHASRLGKYTPSVALHHVSDPYTQKAVSLYVIGANLHVLHTHRSHQRGRVCTSAECACYRYRMFGVFDQEPLRTEASPCATAATLSVS